jgi:hypothetical protein
MRVSRWRVVGVSLAALVACDGPGAGEERGEGGAADVGPAPTGGTEADAAITNPDAAITNPDAAVGSPDAAVASPDAAVVDPDAAVVDPDAAGVDPDAAVVDPDAGGLACAGDLVPPLAWSEAGPERPLTGALELGHTHVTRTDERRQAPRPVAERDTLVLFTPDAPLPAGAELRLAVMLPGEPPSVLAMSPPERPVAALEQGLTEVPLAPYAPAAFSVVVPWFLVRPGAEWVIQSVGEVEGGRPVFRHRLDTLAPPHDFTLARTRAILFGEPEVELEAPGIERVPRDFFPALPFAGLRSVDFLPWRLDQIVVHTADGPRVVSSEAERRALATDADHWPVLKHQVALRHSLANTGRGLTLTDESAGDDSPFSSGTSLAMGWFRDPDGLYVDLDDAPWAAGWTGWTAMWADPCGNGLIHELGHSFTLAHFTEGTALDWGIADEYPDDGVNLVSHPWGFDAVRHRLRTWFRVDATGPVVEGGAPVGKHDPMNGGESPNASTCYPQYTAYHARRIQDWAESSPVWATRGGRAGAWVWDADAQDYAPIEPPTGTQPLLATEVPVATIVGTLSRDPEGTLLMPPSYGASGNVFALPDPADPALPAEFIGARWFLEITYVDGTLARAAIARPPIVDDTLALYSVNLDLTRAPRGVRLMQAEAGWPDLDPATAVEVASLALDPPAASRFAPVVRVGRGLSGGEALTLDQTCEPGVNCARRERRADFRLGSSPVTFGLADAPPPPEALCTPAGDHTRLQVEVAGPDGERLQATIFAQRVVQQGEHVFATALSDTTPYIDRPDVQHTLRVWLPHAENLHLPAGRVRSVEPLRLAAWQAGAQVSTVQVSVDFERFEAEAVTLPPTYTGPPATTPSSSVYFLLRDPAIGPTQRVWWADEDDRPVALRVPVVDLDAGEAPAILVLRAEQVACGGTIDFHAGRGAGDCEHSPVLRVDAADNAGLVRGHRYRTPASAPLVFDARRWHDPGGQQLLRTYALDVTHVPD